MFTISDMSDRDTTSAQQNFAGLQPLPSPRRTGRRVRIAPGAFGWADERFCMRPSRVVARRWYRPDRGVWGGSEKRAAVVHGLPPPQCVRAKLAPTRATFGGLDPVLEMLNR